MFFFLESFILCYFYYDFFPRKLLSIIYFNVQTIPAHAGHSLCAWFHDLIWQFPLCGVCRDGLLSIMLWCSLLLLFVLEVIRIIFFSTWLRLPHSPCRLPSPSLPFFPSPDIYLIHRVAIRHNRLLADHFKGIIPLSNQFLWKDNLYLCNRFYFLILSCLYCSLE